MCIKCTLAVCVIGPVCDGSDRRVLRPVWNVLEDRIPIVPVNARHVHMFLGRKTDVTDAAWLAQPCEVGLLRGSFVPPRLIRELRDFTRYRKRLTQDRTREGHFSNGASFTTIAVPETRTTSRRFGTMNIRPTCGFSSTFRKVSPRWFPGRSGKASVFGSSTRTNPGGSPLGATSIALVADALETTTNGLRSIQARQCSSM